MCVCVCVCVCVCGRAPVCVRPRERVRLGMRECVRACICVCVCVCGWVGGCILCMCMHLFHKLLFCKAFRTFKVLAIRYVLAFSFFLYTFLLLITFPS